MRGKPIERVGIEDIHHLITDGVAEGRRIEFKADVPVSSEEQKAHAKLTAGERLLDRSWIQGKALRKFGRDSLMEEVVAFANADGGTLVLGMEETADQPPRASRINALPEVAGLERRLRDALIDCVEPRLPYVAVRAVPVTEDGSGIVLVEVGASALSPHWVSSTRKPTIRREDRCDQLSMSEVHDMVLRHSRRIDTMTNQLTAERVAFVKAFPEYVRSKKPGNFIGDTDGTERTWLERTGQAALGAQVTIVPHFDLALRRLESLAGLIPSMDAIMVEGPAEPLRSQFLAPYEYASGNPARILGGVKADQVGGFDKSVRAMRDGTVTVSFKQIVERQHCTCTADLILGAAGFAMGLFDQLRQKASYPSTPAEVTIDICTRGHVGVGGILGVNHQGSFGRLDEHVIFPCYGLGEAKDISAVLQEIGADLMNAGGMPSSHLPRVWWDDESDR
ncbi:hypothetical protein J2X48_001377 [Bosea sp. BE271]|uniref:AlbA family DNA-binding domain-containing protein n=1 Tax=Bosea TaxID=85413 RepID=UPI00285599C1|nr:MULTISPECIES: ATP-binding protein [Bosea]MDR6827651.1 hypothetical protein [Bosea robiniae]MDR6894655.1 hypothetical protein [Bosea sp. BE109]MDR7137757.1 hypothetical protein [Bosea sp. BE168]MDR7174456.1 hypothetical protein [Bosea sp. BE271]